MVTFPSAEIVIQSALEHWKNGVDLIGLSKRMTFITLKQVYTNGSSASIVRVSLGNYLILKNRHQNSITP